MNTSKPLTAAQQAQQANRNPDGTYREKHTTGAATGIDLGADTPDKDDLYALTDPIAEAHNAAAPDIIRAWENGEEEGTLVHDGHTITWELQDEDDEDVYIYLGTPFDDPELKRWGQMMHYAKYRHDDGEDLEDCISWPNTLWEFTDGTGWDEDENLTLYWAPDKQGDRVETESLVGLMSRGVDEATLAALAARMEGRRAAPVARLKAVPAVLWDTDTQAHTDAYLAMASHAADLEGYLVGNNGTHEWTIDPEDGRATITATDTDGIEHETVYRWYPEDGDGPLDMSEDYHCVTHPNGTQIDAYEGGGYHVVIGETGEEFDTDLYLPEDDPDWSEETRAFLNRYRGY